MHETKGGDPAEILDNFQPITDHFSDEGKARYAMNAISDTSPEHLKDILKEALNQLTDEQRKQLLAEFAQQQAAE